MRRDHHQGLRRSETMRRQSRCKSRYPPLCRTKPTGTRPTSGRQGRDYRQTKMCRSKWRRNHRPPPCRTTALCRKLTSLASGGRVQHRVAQHGRDHQPVDRRHLQQRRYGHRHPQHHHLDAEGSTGFGDRPRVGPRTASRFPLFPFQRQARTLTRPIVRVGAFVHPLATAGTGAQGSTRCPTPARDCCPSGNVAQRGAVLHSQGADGGRRSGATFGLRTQSADRRLGVGHNRSVVLLGTLALSRLET
jgi:hypothetical protein